jgi:UDP-glucuronate 4-epimerase
MDYISALEASLGVTANKELLPLQKGDVIDTYANVDDLVADFDYQPNTNVSEGISNFVKWYRDYHK